MLSLEGGTIANAHVTSPLSGWVMGLAADKTLFEAPIRTTILIAGARRRRDDAAQPAAGGLVGAADRAADRADRAGHPRADAAPGDHRSRTPACRRPTARSNALASTARVFEQHDKERDEREAHVRLIMRELSHRSKNLLAIVLAIARQTSRHTTSFSDFESRFNSRIQALADAHDLLVEQQWSGALIDDLVRAQLAAFGMEKVACHGERIMLRAEAVQNVALALHELATNASKYGALSVPAGKVNIDWAREHGDAGERNLRLTWRESGGPPVIAARARRASAASCWSASRSTRSAKAGLSSTRTAWSGPASSGPSIWSTATRRPKPRRNRPRPSSRWRPIPSSNGSADRRRAPYTRLPALQLQKSRPSSRMNFASTILCTSSAPSTSRAARAAR